MYKIDITEPDVYKDIAIKKYVLKIGCHLYLSMTLNWVRSRAFLGRRFRFYAEGLMITFML